MFAVIGACAQPDSGKSYSVDDIRENIRAWDGEEITVEGWLGKCQGYDCAIYPTLDDARVVAAMNVRSDVWTAAMDRRVSIGSQGNFDAAAAPLQFQYVKIKGRISDECRDWQGKPACLDRSADIHPFSVQAIPIKDK